MQVTQLNLHVASTQTKHLLKEESLLMTKKADKTVHGICIYCDIEIANHPKDFNSMGVMIINKDKDSDRYMKSYGSAHIICDTRINNDKKFYNWVLNKPKEIA